MTVLSHTDRKFTKGETERGRKREKRGARGHCPLHMGEVKEVRLTIAGNVAVIIVFVMVTLTALPIQSAI